MPYIKGQKISKINLILMEWITGDIYSLKWMKERNIPQNLAYLYYERGILDKIGPGIYKKKGDLPSWMGGIRLLQQELGKSIYISSRTALELGGAFHFTPMNKRQQIFLISYKKDRLPEWFKKIDFQCDFVFKNSALFKNDFFTSNSKKILSIYKSQVGISIKISSRELAVLELLNLLNLENSFETAENYLSGLPGLRSDVLQLLLENCSSIKLKRIFLYLAEKVGYDYIKRIDSSRIHLGSGKRQVVKHNSQLDKKYQITVPKD